MAKAQESAETKKITRKRLTLEEKIERMNQQQLEMYQDSEENVTLRELELADAKNRHASAVATRDALKAKVNPADLPK